MVRKMSHVDGCSHMIQDSLLKTLSNWISVKNWWLAKILNIPKPPKPYFPVISLFSGIKKVHGPIM
jgi:hypothetical protein